MTDISEDQKALEALIPLPPMNNKKAAIIRHIELQKAAYDKVVKAKGLEDLFIFNKYVLDVEQGKQKLGKFHKELCHFVTDDIKRKKLILMPRGHLKSTLVTIGYSLQRIVQNPNVRILILNATYQLATDFLTEIKRHLQQNQYLRELYPEIAESADAPTEWSQDRITLQRTDHNIKGPTVWASGVESNLVGSHPDLIIMDDVVNRDNTSTREQIEKVILRYKDALDLLEPGGSLIVVGTRWVEADMYSWLMDKDSGIRQSYDIMIKKSYTGDLLTGEDFQALWPEKFSLKELQDRQREKGWYEFSAQYQNNPIPQEDADFKKEWFQYYDIEEYRGQNVKTVMSIDPAISLDKDADYTAITVWAVDGFGNIFNRDIARGHWKPNQIIDQIFNLYELWHPEMVLLETVAYQKALAYSLREEMQTRRRFLPIVEIKQQEKSKDQRIRGLQPLYMNKKMFHRKQLPLTSYLEEELLAFPRSKHDDLIDSLSMTLDYLIKPRQKVNRYKHQYLYKF